MAPAMITIAVVEDSPKSMEQMKQFLERYRQEHDLEFQTSFYPDSVAFLEQYRPQYDIIFLDVVMPGIDGMETARRIRAQDADVILVFVTRMAQLALKGYEVQAMDFLVKPLNYDAFELRMGLLLERLPRQRPKSLLISTREGKWRIVIDRLIYVEVIKHKLFYHTKDDTFETSGTMKEAEEQLEGCAFSRCDNSLLVNLRYVTWVGQTELTAGDCRLKISRPRRKQFLQELADYVGGAT
ncbi:MAG: LytTR family DNA-binding domain-containing protein [Clostridiales bacterium]|nr:LytTR family DNA-binding domain-containing protein [Clostridiales bacterium]